MKESAAAKKVLWNSTFWGWEACLAIWRPMPRRYICLTEQ